MMNNFKKFFRIKRLRISALLSAIALAEVDALIFSTPLHAQQAVVVTADPTALVISQQDQALQIANHSQNIGKWVESIQSLNTQINKMQEYIQVANTVKGYIGDPMSAIDQIGLGLLGPNELGQSVGQLTGAIHQTVSGSEALANSGKNLFTPIEFKTPSGLDIERALDLYKPYGAIQMQEANVTTVIKDTLSRIKQLQQDKADTLLLLKNATSETAAQKLQAKIDAIDGEIAALGIQQATATDQIITQDIANRNDREMKAQAARESADKELSVSIDNYMQWQGQVKSSRKSFN